MWTFLNWMNSNNNNRNSKELATKSGKKSHNATKRKSFNRINSPHFCHHRNTLHTHAFLFPAISVFFRVCRRRLRRWFGSCCLLSAYCLGFGAWFCSLVYDICLMCHATIAKQIRFIGFDEARIRPSVFACIRGKYKWVVCLGN